jgi:(2R)-ethylmalonyl-CoA mutase
MGHRLDPPDRPWMMRTYAGHSTAAARTRSTARTSPRARPGLSIAFDLPTQTGYDPDDELARGEVGKVGVPVAHKGDMHALMDGIPLGAMNTSMTINATAAWLLGALHRRRRGERHRAGGAQGTTQNDIIKEFLAAGPTRSRPRRRCG